MLPALAGANALLNLLQGAQNQGAYRGNPAFVGGQLGGQVGGYGDQTAYLDVGGPYEEYVGGPFSGLRQGIQNRQANRNAQQEFRQDARSAQALARIAQRNPAALAAEAAGFDAPNPGVDVGQIFAAANLNGTWKRTGIVLECPMNAAQTSVTAAASLAMSVEPEREVEVMGFELSVEGGATNIEYQETQRASFGITTLAVGQDSMRAASGEGAGTMLDGRMIFRGYVAKSGRNINLTLKNNGITVPINVSALVQYVVPA